MLYVELQNTYIWEENGVYHGNVKITAIGDI
jgi:hypothetical protein